MRYKRLGERENFEEFLLNQVKIYNWMLQNHYGLPLPEDHRESHIRIAVKPARLLVANTLSEEVPVSSEFQALYFEKETIQLGKKCAPQDVWVLR